MRDRARGLKCFSPEVMLATFVLEIFLAIYTVVRYRMTAVSRLVVAILLLLSIFQAAEYSVCATSFIPPDWAVKIGYMAITLLPPLGIHLVYTLAGAARRTWLAPAYVGAGLFCAFFLIGNAITGHACQGNYVIFGMAPGSEWVYTLYYYGLLAVGLWISAKLGETATAKVRRSLQWLMVGYAAFIVPTTAANIIDSSTIAGIPSIMCGFAVLLAVALVCFVMPVAGRQR